MWKTLSFSARVSLLAIGSSCGHSAPPRLSSAPVDASWTAPARPRLPETADTNDAGAYEVWGQSKIADAPDTAAAAFYWASRLDPWRASAYYQRAVALVLTHAQRPAYGVYVRPWMVTKQLSTNELAMVDSLNRLAMLRDPFLYRTLDRFLSGSPRPSIVSRMRDPAQRGFWQFTIGQYDSSLVYLGKALKKKPDLTGLRVMRAISFYYEQQYDSTAAELETVLSRLKAVEDKEVVVFYQSKAMIHYALGIALVQQGDARARDHFEAALVEDLSFYMARVRLAGLDLSRADTTAAIASLEQAVELKEDDPALRYFHGLLLVRRDPTAARKSFERAVTLAPEYALPHLQLAVLADLRGDTTAAIAGYDRFLALSSFTEPVVATARARRKILAHQVTVTPH